MTRMQLLYLAIPLVPLVAAIVAGLFGKAIGRAGAHWVTIIGVGISFFASCAVFADVLNGNTFNGPVYTWLTAGETRFEIGFLIDRLTALMMVVVTFVSWMVHIYTVGYMADDDTSPGGYQRFFSYISLFTFSMLMLVMSEQLPPALLRLGGGGSRLVPPHRLLLPAADGDLRQPEGVPGEPGGRLRLPARDRAGPRLLRHARLRGGLRRGAEDGRADDRSSSPARSG